MKSSNILICVVVLFASVLSCNKKSDSSSTDSNENIGSLDLDSFVNLNVKAVSSLDLTSAQADSSIDNVQSGSLIVSSSLHSVKKDKFKLAVETVPPLSLFSQELSSIASGAPDYLAMNVTKLSIDCHDEDQTKKVCNGANGIELFSSTNGAELIISKAKVDISAFISEAIKSVGEQKDGLKFGVAPGVYNRVSLTVKSKIKIKGCVQGNFRDYASTTFESSTAQKYSKEQIYCTKSSGNFYEVSAKTNSIDLFKSSSVTDSEVMNIKLNHPVDKWWEKDIAAVEDVTLSYTIPEGIEVKSKESTDITMLIDMNRILRFETSAKLMKEEEQQSSKDFSTTKYPPYFFDTLIESSTFLFLGKPGKIYGYETQTLSCDTTKYSLATNCNDNKSWHSVDGWHTIITNPKGTPIISLFMPNDDNTLTIIKGSTRNIALTDWLIYDADSKTADIKYYLGQENKEFGIMRGFLEDLDAISVGDSFPNALKFEVTDESSSNSGAQGYVYYKRQL